MTEGIIFHSQDNLKCRCVAIPTDHLSIELHRIYKQFLLGLTIQNYFCRSARSLIDEIFSAGSVAKIFFVLFNLVEL